MILDLNQDIFTYEPFLTVDIIFNLEVSSRTNNGKTWPKIIKTLTL